MRVRLWCAAAAVVLSLEPGLCGETPVAPHDPFAFLAPSIVVSREERARLDRNDVVTRTLSRGAGQLAVFAAARINAPPDALAVWTHAIAELKRSTFVLAIGRFSDPPILSDLERLTLDQDDLDAIRRCHPGDCALKLSAADIASLTSVIAGAGSEWREKVQQEFRRLLVTRVLEYRAGGLGALARPADGKTSMSPKDALAAIVDQSPYLQQLPELAAWLTKYPQGDSTVDSFFYWSKERYGEGKPVITITHVAIVRPEPASRLPAIVVAGKQIFATHYVDGSLGLTMVVSDASTGAIYLTYLNRSRVDLLRGLFGGLVRSVLESRIERQAPQIVRSLRTRLESGPPPDERQGQRGGAR